MLQSYNNITTITDGSHRAVQAIELSKKLANIIPPQGRQIVVSCGIDCVGEALSYKASGAFVVAVLDPTKRQDEFDLVVVPSHDPHPNLPNFIETTGLINHISPEFLLSYIKPEFAGKIAVLIGGKHIGGNFTVDDAKRLLADLKGQGDLLITTSKRTEVGVVDFLRKNISQNDFLWDYNTDGQAANPYYSILASANLLVVTADSVRMCSEACSSGKAAAIFTPEQTHFSYLSLRDMLINGDFACDLSDIKPTKNLNEAERVAKMIIDIVAN